MTNTLLRLEEVAAEARAPLSSVRYWISSGRLPSVRPGRRRLVRRIDLDAFLARDLSNDVGARGLTRCGGNPGRLTPTADPNADGQDAPPDQVQGGVDRPGVARGEAQSAEGPSGPCPRGGAPRSGERARPDDSGDASGAPSDGRAGAAPSSLDNCGITLPPGRAGAP